MAKQKSCVPDMVAATDGILSKEQAEKLITEISAQARERAAAKGMTIEDAVREVAWERKNEINLSAALNKKMAALQAKTKMQAIRFIKNTKDKAGRVRWDKNMAQYMENMAQSGHYLGAQFMANFHDVMGDLSLRSKLASDEKFKDDVMEELFEVSDENPNVSGVTGNKEAIRVAEAFVMANRMAVDLKRTYGAEIRQARGWAIPQTHDEMRIQASGGNSKDPTVRYSTSLKAWRESLDGLNVDTDRTLHGQPMEQFQGEFHNDVYYRDFRDDPDLDGNPYTKTGSLAKKIGSERKLWFKDAASQRAYNKMWGRNDLYETMLSHLMQSGRTIALLQHLGPSPDHNLESISSAMIDMVKKSHGDPKLIKAFQSDKFENRLAYLSGRANSTVNPNVSKTFEGIRNVNLLTKGVNIVISALGDKVFMYSEAVMRGVPRLEAFGKSIFSRLDKSADGQRIAKEMGFYLQARNGHIASRWMNEDRIAGPLSGGVHKLFKATGLTHLTNVHQHSMGDMAAYHLGRNSESNYSGLSHDFRSELESFGIDNRDWDLIRQSSWKTEDGSPVITADAVRKLPNEALDESLTSRGLEPAPGNRKRLREDLASKVGVCAHTFVSRGVPAPNLAARTAMTLGARPKGEVFGRELWDLAMVFKGFPVAAAMSFTRNVGGQFSQGHLGKGMWYVSSMIASSLVAGYAITTIKDFLRGRTPRQLVTNGEINWGVLTAAITTGGGLGIYGDFLLSEYDRRSRTPLSAVAGPVLGSFTDAALLVNRGLRGAFGDEDVNVDSLGYEAFRFAEQNTPLINLLPLKGILDYLIFWHIKEGLSPGIITRQKQSIEEHNHQEFFLEPVTY